MHPNPAFQMRTNEEMTEFISARPFATLVVNGEAGPLAAHLPMLAMEDVAGRIQLEGHVARSNALARLPFEGMKAMAIFHGADAYVTPSLYASKREHGRVVPTWNYMAVHACGALSAFDDGAELRLHLERLTGEMEKDLAAPWAVADAPSDYVARLSHGIVGVRLHVERFEGIRKLSQNKSAPDRAGVLDAFDRSDNDDARALATEMKRDTAL